jgi:tetratricopeptide (TPR) repeat protein
VQLASADTLEDGLGSLAKGLSDAFKAERAAMILRRAAEQHAGHSALLDMYEQVARRCEDDRVLLHYLQCRAAHADATPEHAREAVDVAIRLEQGDVAEALMLRAAEIGRTMSRADDLKRIDWALLGLAERRMLAGDLAGAVKWLGDATDVADLSELFAAGARVAELAAQPDGDLTLAAKLYERLRERAPDAREAWEPLARIYARLDDVERLERMVEETLDGLQEPSDRNALRVALGRALLRHEDRAEQAVGVLQDVLIEEPEQAEAQHLLFEHLERTGQHGEVALLLQRQLDAATDRGDVAAIKHSSLALVRRVEADDRERALDLLRRALRWAPGDEDLLHALLSSLGEDDVQERCELSTALIRVEPADVAGPRALALVQLYVDMGDQDSALEALKLGAERAPENAAIVAQLQARFREVGDFAGLADSLLAAAERCEEGPRMAALLRETAAVRRDELGDAAGAAQLLERACASSISDVDLRVELGRTYAAAAMHDQAVRCVSDALETTADGEPRMKLLRARAELHAATGDQNAAIADLEQAFGIDPRGVADELAATLSRALDASIATGDESAERAHTLRLVDVLVAQHRREDASQMLSTWTERRPDDVEALRNLRELDTADGRWPAVAETCERLLRIEHGAALVDAALGLSHAHLEMGEPAGAREGLELALSKQPDSPQIRAGLRKIYEQLEDQTYLAKLLIEDANALESETERAALLRRVGHIYVETGDMSSAIGPLKQANELAPGQPAAIVPLSDAYILMARFDDANELLDAAIAAGKGRRTPEICVYYHRKAQVADAQGDSRAQVDLLLEAHQCNKKNGLVAADLANAAEEIGDWDLAQKTLRTITLIDTECPISRAEAFLRQGRIARMQGDEKSAKMWARRAKREDPDWDEIDAFLQELGERTSVAPGRGR